MKYKNKSSLTFVAAAAALIVIIFTINLVIQNSFRKSTPLHDNKNQTSLKIQNEGWKVYENLYLFVGYPADWFNTDNIIQNYQVEKFTTVKQEAERMKQVDKPIRMRFGQIFVKSEQKKLSYEDNIQESFKWIEFDKQFMQSDIVSVEDSRELFVDGEKGVSYYVRQSRQPGYEPGIYPGFSVSQEIYIPLEEVIINVTVYGEVVSSKDQIDEIIDTIQIKK